MGRDAVLRGEIWVVVMQCWGGEIWVVVIQCCEMIYGSW